MDLSPVYMALLIAAFVVLIITSHLSGTGAVSAAISAYSLLVMVCAGLLSTLASGAGGVAPRIAIATLTIVTVLLGLTVAYIAIGFDAIAQGHVAASAISLSRLSIFFFLIEIASITHTTLTASTTSTLASKQTTAQIVVFLLALIHCIIVATMVSAMRYFVADG